MFLLSIGLVIVALDCALLIGARHLPPTPTMLVLGFFLPLAMVVAINLDLPHHILHPLRGWLRRRRQMRPGRTGPVMRSPRIPGST